MKINKKAITEDRNRKAGKIASILTDFIGTDMKNFTCLDLGCGQGVISGHLSDLFRIVVGIDPDIERVAAAQASKFGKSISPHYLLGSGHHIPIKDGMFDVVVWAQVYEHVDNAPEMVQEIARVLRPGGICFFSGPNRLTIMEEHYWLPFLSWLPHPLASAYMRLFKRGKEYDIYPMYYGQLIKMWQGFEVHDYMINILRSPRRFSVDERVEKYGLVKIIPDWLIQLLRPVYPNYNWVLVKKHD